MNDFARRLLAWFDAHGRHDLPWQRDKDPYRVWVSEIMLQQTRVATVIPYFERFIARFPGLQALAAADEDEVMAVWSGLGYYARARNMIKAARQMDGQFPESIEALAALPGIGRSTAAAILALAHDQRHPILDGNCKRVYARHGGIDGWPGTPRVAAVLWNCAETQTPAQRGADFTQAIMDLGATVCTRIRPRCSECPVATDCIAHAQGRTGELPAARPRRVKQVRSTNALIIRDESGHVLMERRPAHGIWGGLWCVPMLAEEEMGGYGVNAGEGVRRPVVRHAFTHFTLDISPIELSVKNRARILANEGQDWIAPGSIAGLGLPAPVRRLLESAP